MGMNVPVDFRGDRELAALEGFSNMLPHFVGGMMSHMTPRVHEFADGALETIGRDGLWVVFAQHDIGGAIASTVAIVDADGLEAMKRGEDMRPAISLTSYAGTGYPGIQAILTALPDAVEIRLAEHAVEPSISGNFDWCVAIERRTGSRARRARPSETGGIVEMTPNLAAARRRVG